MIKQFAALLKIQRELDETIESNHGLTGANLIPYKLLAFQVELGELANETRCFKFWSKKPASAKDIILEEYVDGLHFLMSLGLDSGHEPSAEFWRVVDQLMTGTKEELSNIADHNAKQTAAFQKVFKALTAYNAEHTLPVYKQLFADFLVLGDVLGFSIEQMVEAYLEKNKVNYERQEQGY